MSIWPERIAAQTELHLSVISSFAFDSKDQKYRTVDSQESEVKIAKRMSWSLADQLFFVPLWHEKSGTSGRCRF